MSVSRRTILRKLKKWPELNAFISLSRERNPKNNPETV
jgi:hypothetical protein